MITGYEDDDHWPEFGTLTVRDTRMPEEGQGLFDQHALDAQPCGTIARSGCGWLEVGAGDGPLVVRLELHDAAPADDIAAWEDAVDVPYRCLSGVVGLTYVTGGPGDEHLRLPGPGDYRVRTTRSADTWSLRFWPVAEPEAPQWFARSLPAVPQGDSGWSELFGHYATDLLFAVHAARDRSGLTTVEALRRWGEQHHRGAGWLDQPVPEPLRGRLSPAEVAAQLGAPAPTALRGMLPLFAAAGVLIADGQGYRSPDTTPRAQDVLDLPAPRRAALDADHELSRFRSFATDLVSIALWGRTRHTVPALAARTLVSEQDVLATLDWAVRRGPLVVDGPLSGEFALRVSGS